MTPRRSQHLIRIRQLQFGVLILPLTCIEETRAETLALRALGQLNLHD